MTARQVPTAASAAALALALSAAAVSAHVVSDREVRVTQQIARGDLAAVLGFASPDGAGRVEPADPAAGWTVGDQADAMLSLMCAASHSDSASAERAWKAVDFSFLRQRQDGGFDREAPARFEPATDPGPIRFMGELGRAQIALENGPLQARFHWRVVLMLPKLRHSLDSLAAGATTVAARDAGRAGALMSAAECLLVGDGLYHVEAIGLAGRKLLAEALATQASSGQFRGSGPGALAEHAEALEKLQPLVLYFPAPALEDAEKRAASWLLERIEAGTESSDWCAAPSCPATAVGRRAQAQALFALLHDAARSGDSGFRSRVERAVRRWAAAGGK